MSINDDFQRVTRLRSLLLIAGGAISLIVFSMLQKKLMGVTIAFQPKALVVPILFGGGSGLIIAIWQERLRAAMAALTASEERYRTVTDFASDFTFWISPEGSLLYASPAAERVTGFTSQEFTANPELLDKIIHPDDLPVWRNHLNYHNEHGECDEVHIRILTKSGDIRWIRHICRPIHDEHGRYLGLRGSNSDISDIKNAELEIKELNLSLEERIAERTASLEQAVEEMNCLNEDLAQRTFALEESNLSLEAFSYSVSHDLRTPVRHISTFSHLLADEHGAQLDDEGKAILSRIVGGCRRMDELIAGLLDFSRVNSQDVHHELIKPALLVQEVLAELQPELVNRNATIIVNELPECSADYLLIKQVYANLIGNAVKYTGKTADARIEIGADKKSGETVYYVRDNGPGFDMAYADKLFGVFQRLHGREFEGTGIGLATVKRIVRRHGGRVWAEAAVGSGATFYFTL